MKATLSNYKQPPRKVRLVADLIRGKSVRDAEAALTFLPKKSAPVFKKLLSAAFANAGKGTRDQLIVKKLTVDKGKSFRRARPFARGRAGTIRKQMSHITLELGSGDKAKAKKS